MIDKLRIKPVEEENDFVIRVLCQKINELVDAINLVEMSYRRHLNDYHSLKASDYKEDKTLAKLEMHKATLQDLEEEIRKGSV